MCALRTSSSSHCTQSSPLASSIETSAAASSLSSVNPRARCVFWSRSSTPDTQLHRGTRRLNWRSMRYYDAELVDGVISTLLLLSKVEFECSLDRPGATNLHIHCIRGIPKNVIIFANDPPLICALAGITLCNIFLPVCSRTDETYISILSARDSAFGEFSSCRLCLQEKHSLKAPDFPLSTSRNISLIFHLLRRCSEETTSRKWDALD